MRHHAVTTRRAKPSWATGLAAIAAGLALTALLPLAAGAASASARAIQRVGATNSARLHETIVVNPAGRTLYTSSPRAPAHHLHRSAREAVAAKAGALAQHPAARRQRRARTTIARRPPRRRPAGCL